MTKSSIRFKREKRNKNRFNKGCFSPFEGIGGYGKGMLKGIIMMNFLN
jgi:hypothetical protein